MTDREKSTLRALALRELRYGRQEKGSRMNGALTEVESATLDRLRSRRDGGTDASGN